MISYENPIDNLPDSYDKSADSNNSKILRLNKSTTDIIDKVIDSIFGALNLNNTSGRALDDIWSGRLNLERGSLTDEQYKIRLRTKMMQNIANGSFPDLIEALAYALQCEKSDIHIVESDEPNKVIVKDIPLALLLQADFTTDQVLTLINSLLAVNVTVSEYGFTGTFEFGETENEYDEEKGFADMSQTIGGYLGVYGG